MCPELGKLQLDTSPSIQRGAGNSPSTEARMRDTISATVTAFGRLSAGDASVPLRPGSVGLALARIGTSFADPPVGGSPGSVASRMHPPFEPLGNLLDGGRLPRRRIHVDEQAVQLYVAIRHVRSDGDARQEALENLLGLAPDDRIIPAGHADIG